MYKVLRYLLVPEDANFLCLTLFLNPVLGTRYVHWSPGKLSLPTSPTSHPPPPGSINVPIELYYLSVSGCVAEWIRNWALEFNSCDPGQLFHSAVT